MTTMIASADVVGIKRALEYRLAHVGRRIAVLRQRSCSEELQGGGDNTPLSESTDAMQAIETRALENEEFARLLTRAEILDAALRRVRNGSYGTCERCKRLIDPKRLRALPEAIHCVTCEERLERFP